MHVESSKILPVYLASEILDIIHFVGDEKHQKRYINRPPKDVEQVVTEIAITISTNEINCSPTFSIFSDIFVIQNMN
jgi:hypothetical protein